VIEINDQQISTLEYTKLKRDFKSIKVMVQYHALT